MRRVELRSPAGVRWLPRAHGGAGVLVLAGSSGRVDEPRARLLAARGCIAESVQWFGGPGQHPGPWLIPLETFAQRIADLARDCDRVYLAGTSFGAEAALATAALTPAVAGVAAFAPSDVVWAGIDRSGRQVSHWTLGGQPLPFVRFDESWRPEGDPPAYRSLYVASRRAAGPAAVAAAAIAVERIQGVLTVAGGDDEVWPSDLHARHIAERRAAHGMATVAVSDPDAGHRAVLPGEPVVSAGQRMRRGGTQAADRRLGARALDALVAFLAGSPAPPGCAAAP